jgi:hypothetical protein
MKNTKLRASEPARPVKPKLDAGHRVFRAQVEVGDVISFDPTGEQLRVSKIENGQITFEKLP